MDLSNVKPADGKVDRRPRDKRQMSPSMLRAVELVQDSYAQDLTMDLVVPTGTSTTAVRLLVRAAAHLNVGLDKQLIHDGAGETTVRYKARALRTYRSN